MSTNYWSELPLSRTDIVTRSDLNRRRRIFPEPSILLYLMWLYWLLSAPASCFLRLQELRHWPGDDQSCSSYEIVSHCERIHFINLFLNSKTPRPILSLARLWKPISVRRIGFLTLPFPAEFGPKILTLDRTVFSSLTTGISS